MLRRYGWLAFSLVALCVVVFYAVSQWQRDRADRLAADALLSDLRNETARLRAHPGEFGADDLHNLLDFQKDVVERSRQVLPRAPAESRQLLNEALKEYLEAIRSVREDRKGQPPN